MHVYTILKLFSAAPVKTSALQQMCPLWHWDPSSHPLHTINKQSNNNLPHGSNNYLFKTQLGLTSLNTLSGR